MPEKHQRVAEGCYAFWLGTPFNNAGRFARTKKVQGVAIEWMANWSFTA